ncbi:MAG: sugar transferase [Lachnospiraceae bacterium]|nr:sugar transferase [Lachnospiraceae bacterium]
MSKKRKRRCQNEMVIWRKRLYLRIKRIQDILLSALLLTVLSPFLAFIALAVVFDDPHGSPIFIQTRCGQKGKEFRLYKFRTMYMGAEQRLKELLPYNEMVGPAFKIRNDPRITRLGRLLRASGIDELPQLVNVLKGDMSIVGPRPPLPREVAKYTAYQRRRLEVKPGLTCFWQVHPARNSLDFDSWVKLDLRYIKEQSWWLDWKLIFLTVGAMIRREGL